MRVKVRRRQERLSDVRSSGRWPCKGQSSNDLNISPTLTKDLATSSPLFRPSASLSLCTRFRWRMDVSLNPICLMKLFISAV